MIFPDFSAPGVAFRRLCIAALVLCVCTVSSHAAPVLDRAACLNAPTQDCVFALALEESEILHLDRMFPRRNISDEKKAQWREELKDPARKAKWEKFFRTFRGYKIVAAEQAEAGLLDRALDTARIVGSINKKMAVWSLRDIVERLARKGDFAGIERVFPQIDNESARMRAGEAIIDVALDADLAEPALEFLTKLEPKTERARLLRSLAFRLSARGDRSEARKIAALADTVLQHVFQQPIHRIRYLIDLGDVETARKEMSQFPDVDPYRRGSWAQALAIHYAKKGDAKKAYEFLGDVIPTKRHAKTSVKVPALLAEHFELQEEAIRRANGVVDTELRSHALFGVARVLAERGDVAGANRVIGLLSDAKHIDRANRLVGITLARKGDLAAAQRMIAKVRDENFKRGGLTALAKNQALAGDIAGARRSIANLPPRSVPVDVDEEIAVALARSGRVREGIEAGLNHWNFETRIRILSRIAVALGVN